MTEPSTIPVELPARRGALRGVASFVVERRVHFVLFGLTLATTAIAHGGWYAAGIIAILLSHELGHFFMCVRHGVGATLPFFLPGLYIPFVGFVPPFGTFGAVIRMRPPVPDAEALFDIGVAGPIAGFLVTLPCLFLGYHLSTITTAADAAGYFQLGDSLATYLVGRLFFGPLPAGQDVLLHPLAFAGWVGLLVTGLNLIPIGQLDGGHIVYAVFGKKSRFIFLAFLVAMMGIQTFAFPGWALFIVLVVVLLFRHPPVGSEEVPLGKGRKMIAVLALVIFLLSFMPVPFIL
jgi:membrane-associated protease RseP (regulator of RpoE activity)